VSWDELLFDDTLIRHLRQLADYVSQRRALLLFHGTRGSGREKAARAICAQNGTALLRVDVAAALSAQTRWEAIVDLAFREAQLAGAAIYWEDVDLLQMDEQAAYRQDDLRRAAGEFQGLTILSSTAPAESLARLRRCLPLQVDFPVPHFERRRRIWSAYLPTQDELADREVIAETLAGAFQLNEGQVRDAVASARELARRRDVFAPQVTSEDLYEACRKQAGRRLLGFARRLEPSRKLSLDDVILAEPNKRQLRELLNRIRLRSRLYSEMQFGRSLAMRKGLLVLFAGPSGTGKTMSAELLASEEGVDLYKVDLSAVVSKWVGETEKNLNRVFAEAEDSNALLFFDECDALFGQRGEIKEAKDRWANLEVNYLLQRVEEYSGIVIMATNLRQNMDDAFLRRIQVIIEFPSPDSELRLKIWQRSLPPPPHSDIREADLQDLADRFAITGGNIRNIVIDAAFRALAARRSAITLRDLVDAVAREYQKVGKPITQGDFGEAFFGWVVADILSPRAAG
jgi:SpoVK/Ycf46/Vps4 family AAA+-type ATPase